MELPRGRKDLRPALNLLYNSGGTLGIAGLGWLADIGYIEAFTGDGVPQSSPFSSVLVSIAGGTTECLSVGPGAYRALSEAAYQDVRQVGTHWEVRDSNGILYSFGSSSATQIPGAYWALDTVQDPNGNTITIHYTLDAPNNYLYPSQILYTGNVFTGETGTNEIALTYAPRADTRISYRTGARREMKQILTSVSVLAQGQPVRTYQLGYDDSSTTGRSLLQTVTLTGADGTSSVVPRSYQYAIDTLGWGATLATNSVPASLNDSSGKDLGTRIADVNGDNFADVVDNSGNVWLGAGEGHFDSNSTWTASLQTVMSATGQGFTNSDGSDMGMRLMDVNGDLLPDILFAPASGGSAVFLNTGSGWAQDPGFTTSIQGISQTFMVAQQFTNPLCFPPVDAGPDATASDAGIDCSTQTPFTLPFALVRSGGDAAGVLFADVNGDGLVDILWSVDEMNTIFNLNGSNGLASHDVPTSIRAVYVNTGSGWAFNQILSLGLPSTAFVSNSALQGFDAYDANGDGLADLVQTLSGTSQQVLLGNGSAWTVDPEYTANLQGLGLVSIDGATNEGLTEVDYNGDGLVDLIQARTDLPAAAYRNTGSGWIFDDPVSSTLQSQHFALVDANGDPQGFTFADVNGDGKSDLVQAVADTSAIEVALGIAPDLMVQATSGIGEVTNVLWGRSDQFNNVVGGVQQLPLVLPVVTTLLRSDGHEAPFATTMSYANGAYGNRKFLSFAQSTRTDDDGTVRTYVQSQNAHLFGQTLTTTISDASGPRQEAVNTFELVPIASAPTASQVQLTAIDTFQFDGAVQFHSRTRMAYDAFLQLTEVDKDGDVTNPNDGGRTVYQHAQDAASGLVSPISEIDSYDANGDIVARSTILFDGLPQGQVAAGNPTTIFDELLPGGQMLSRTVTYDVYGNPTTVTDAAGETSNYTYDTASHTFRVRAKDALGRALSSQFDPRFAVETENVDLNGNVTTRLVDAFGRVARETLPGDQSSPFGTTTLNYSAIGNATSQTLTVLHTTQTGTSDTYKETFFFDGFGQVYRHDRDGPASRTITEGRSYNVYGNVVASTRPSYIGDPPGATAQVALDALQRPTRVVDANGGTTTYVYSGARVTETDVRGNSSVRVFDAFGRSTELDETVAGAPLITRYAYDALGRLTSVTDPRGGVSSWSFDSLGRTLQSSSPATGTQTFAYDPVGRLLVATDALHHSTTYKYDAVGELTKKVLGTGEVYAIQYSLASQRNSVGRVAQVSDPAGTQDESYDTRGRIIRRDRKTSGITYTTEYAYDSLDRLTRIEYPDGYEIFYNYGTGPWVQSVSDSRGNTIVANIQYDASGNSLNVLDGNQVQSNFSYRTDGALLSIATTSASKTVLQEQSLTRDPAGNLTAIVNSANPGLSQTMVYDELNRLVSAQSNASVGYGEEAYSYDPVGNFSQKGDLLYRVNPSTGLPACVIEQGLAASTASTPRGSPGDPCVIGWSYPSAQRPPGQGGHASQVYRLTYDAAGNLTEKNAFNYAYDADRRLVSVASEGQNYQTNIFAWDGQRVERNTPAASTVFIDSIYETDLSQTRRHVPIGIRVVATVTTSGRAPLAPASAFAAMGLPLAPDLALFTAVRSRMVAAGVWNFAWDGALPRGFAVGMLCAAALFLAWRRLKAAAIASGQGIIHVARGIAKSCLRNPAKWLVAVLVIVAHLAQVTQPTFAQSNAGGETVASARNYYYHFDAVGNVNVITDDSGNQAAHREYTPFGEQLLSFGIDGPLLSDLSFNDHNLDRTPGAQTYSFGARNYDPVLGTFTSADNAIQALDKSQAINLHTFNLNNPFRYVDPTGHDFWDVLAGIFVAVVAIVAVVVVSIATFGLGAVLTGIVIGAAIGGAIGATIAIVGLATHSLTLGQALGVFLAGVLVGGFTGGAIASLAIGSAAAASTTALLTTSTLEGAAAGSLAATAAGIVKVAEGGTVDQFLDGFITGTAIGAAVGLAAGALGSIFGIGTNATSGTSEIDPGASATQGASATVTQGQSAVNAASVNTALAVVKASTPALTAFEIATATSGFIGGLGGALYRLGLLVGPTTTPGISTPFGR